METKENHRAHSPTHHIQTGELKKGMAQRNRCRTLDSLDFYICKTDLLQRGLQPLKNWVQLLRTCIVLTKYSILLSYAIKKQILNHCTGLLCAKILHCMGWLARTKVTHKIAHCHTSHLSHLQRALTQQHQRLIA